LFCDFLFSRKINIRNSIAPKKNIRLKTKQKIVKAKLFINKEFAILKNVDKTPKDVFTAKSIYSFFICYLISSLLFIT